MSEFLYLYHEDESPRALEHMQEQLQKWAVWMKGLGEKGHLKDPGQPLEKTGKFVKGMGASRTVTDGPFAETKDVIGGYTIIEAKDIAQAVELSTGCPILENGGTVEVRPVIKMEM
jgi:hypothetical protein